MPSRNMIRLAFIAAVIATAFVILIIIAFSFFPQIETMLTSKSSGGADVIVVGGGLAGLSATIEASRHGSRVTIIEKEKTLGGNSAKATSGMNGAGTTAQRNLEIEDTPELFVGDTIKSGGGHSKPDLVSILATNSANAVDFITSFSVGLTNVVQLGGHSVRRTHRIPPTADGKPVAVGFTIITMLKKYIENDLSGSVRVLTNSAFQSLLWEGDHVVGVVYKAEDGSEQKLKGNVIFAAGGFANDRIASDSLLEKYVPKLAKLPTTNGVWATGDIIKATAGDGLSLVDMEQVQVHPTGFIEPSKPNAETKFLAPEALRGCGALLLDAAGRRFANELGRRDYVTHSIFEHCAHYQNDDMLPVASAMLMNEQVIERFGVAAVGFYRFKGLIEDVGSLEQVAVKLGVDVGVLRETIRTYQEASDAGEDQFGKVSFPTAFSENDHFYVAFVTPSLHYCMGGLEINKSAQVLKAGDTKKPVPGLFAAGEVTGGVHGVNRLGGNSLLECVVYGRIAGHHAAHSKQ